MGLTVNLLVFYFVVILTGSDCVSRVLRHHLAPLLFASMGGCNLSPHRRRAGALTGACVPGLVWQKRKRFARCPFASRQALGYGRS